MNLDNKRRFSLYFVFVRLIGVIVPGRLRADWRQEWVAELRHREMLLADWDKLNWKTKLNLVRRSLGAFWDALLLQPTRLEDEMFQDLRYGVRMLLKHKGFTAVAALSLSLGIGANTAIFSLIDALLLKSLPVKEPQQLVVFSVVGQGGNDVTFSYPLFERFIYVSYFQDPGAGALTFLLRTTGNPTGFGSAIERTVRELNPRLQVVGLKTMADVVNESLAQERFVAQLASFFSLFGLLLACVGLYGIMSYTVTRRTNEIGIRMALGAGSADVVRLVMKETMLLVAAGVAIGLAAALAATRLIASLLYGLTQIDPVTMAVAASLTIAVAALAGYLPARRASRVDPMTALRYE